MALALGERVAGRLTASHPASGRSSPCVESRGRSPRGGTDTGSHHRTAPLKGRRLAEEGRACSQSDQASDQWRGGLRREVDPPRTTVASDPDAALSCCSLHERGRRSTSQTSGEADAKETTDHQPHDQGRRGRARRGEGQRGNRPTLARPWPAEHPRDGNVFEAELLSPSVPTNSPRGSKPDANENE